MFLEAISKPEVSYGEKQKGSNARGIILKRTSIARVADITPRTFLLTTSGWDKALLRLSGVPSTGTGLRQLPVEAPCW
ncbi:MAG: hypothetical protein CMI18_00375 [Opitutaceae bacterium]|nr:hypothetical protein [Opitutaceae bacterium]